MNISREEAIRRLGSPSNLAAAPWLSDGKSRAVKDTSGSIAIGLPSSGNSAVIPILSESSIEHVRAQKITRGPGLSPEDRDAMTRMALEGDTPQKKIGEMFGITS